mmetsp:Transcript_2320/g.6941  ORF Transcript_2320/g.6941 Transcript_2320/m.6941 type:complete len:423 (+) Transcript_2320:559-1827(+)
MHRSMEDCTSLICSHVYDDGLLDVDDDDDDGCRWEMTRTDEDGRRRRGVVRSSGRRRPRKKNGGKREDEEESRKEGTDSRGIFCEKLLGGGGGGGGLGLFGFGFVVVSIVGDGAVLSAAGDDVDDGREVGRSLDGERGFLAVIEREVGVEAEQGGAVAGGGEGGAGRGALVADEGPGDAVGDGEVRWSAEAREQVVDLGRQRPGGGAGGVGDAQDDGRAVGHVLDVLLELFGRGGDVFVEIQTVVCDERQRLVRVPLQLQHPDADGIRRELEALVLAACGAEGHPAAAARGLATVALDGDVARDRDSVHLLSLLETFEELAVVCFREVRLFNAIRLKELVVAAVGAGRGEAEAFQSLDGFFRQVAVAGVREDDERDALDGVAVHGEKRQRLVGLVAVEEAPAILDLNLARVRRPEPALAVTA